MINFVEIENRKNELFSISNNEIKGFEEIIYKFNQKFDDLFDIDSDYIKTI